MTLGVILGAYLGASIVAYVAMLLIWISEKDLTIKAVLGILCLSLVWPYTLAQIIYLKLRCVYGTRRLPNGMRLTEANTRTLFWWRAFLKNQDPNTLYKGIPIWAWGISVEKELHGRATNTMVQS